MWYSKGPLSLWRNSSMSIAVILPESLPEGNCARACEMRKGGIVGHVEGLVTLWQRPNSNARCLSVCLGNGRYRTNNTHSNRLILGVALSYIPSIRRRIDTSRLTSFLLSESHSWGKLVPMSKRFPQMSSAMFQVFRISHRVHSVSRARSSRSV